jgi:hypothetical protein
MIPDSDDRHQIILFIKEICSAPPAPPEQKDMPLYKVSLDRPNEPRTIWCQREKHYFYGGIVFI